MLSTLDNTIDTPEDVIPLNAVQKSMLARLMNATTLSTMPRVPTNLGASSLLASAYLDEQDSLSLPDNQWILKLQNWFSTSLIALQLHSLSYGQNNDPQWASVNKTAPAADEEWMCNNQIVRRTHYTSFSVFGLAFIIVVGGTIILVNLGLVKIVERFQRKTPRNEYRSLEWTIQGTLQLQRLAYEAHGLGRWHGEGEVPTTVGDESFALPEDKLGLERKVSNSSLDARSLDATGHASGEAYPLEVGPGVAAPRSVSSVEVAPEDDNAGVQDSSRYLLQQDRRLRG